MNTDRQTYIDLYEDYPITSKKYPAFSLAVMYDKMMDRIQESKEISNFNVSN